MKIVAPAGSADEQSAYISRDSTSDSRRRALNPALVSPNLSIYISNMVVRIASRQATALVRVARSSASRTSARNCSMCRSVKDWKENHGTWSKAPKQILTSTTPQSAQAAGQLRAYATGKSLADEKIEEITEAYVWHDLPDTTLDHLLMKALQVQHSKG